MIDIEKIKRQGAVDALKKQIDNMRFELSNRLWEHIIKDGKYVRLGAVIKEGKRKFKELGPLCEHCYQEERNRRAKAVNNTDNITEKWLWMVAFCKKNRWAPANPHFWNLAEKAWEEHRRAGK